MAQAFEMPDHRHARFFLHALHETAAAARHDDVDLLVEAAKHQADGRTVRGRHQLNRRLGQPCFA
jgi:hypothetical protein